MVSCPSPQGSQHKIFSEQAIQQVAEETTSHQVPRIRKLLGVELLWHAALIQSVQKNKV